ncbi:hypothetical protein HYC85_010666 [Camellia sinensis]|uniref:Uncharacterized protein n=1 Tax=Camellia sinensis TaxID=4442 RepID=A0A7J7HII7_CAMSI|nr:hypothetical protein HYC85_010666 [Camellia sinensis]
MANQERNTEATDDAIMSSSSDYNLYLPTSSTYRTTTTGATIVTFKHRTTTSLSLLESQNPNNLVHPFPNHTRDLHLIGSINGLLCLCLSLSLPIHSIPIDASSSYGTPLPNTSNLSPLPPSKFLVDFFTSLSGSDSDSHSILLLPLTTRSSG